MLKRNLISKVLKCFPSLEALIFKIRRKLFLPKQSFIKNEKLFWELNPHLYSETLISIYQELISLYSPTSYRKARKCLKHALKIRKNYTPNYPRTLQLFIDISALVENDFGTGIQRVVRNILSEFLIHPPTNYEIKSIYGNGSAIYRHIESHQPIDVFPGDIFLGLDLSARWTNRYWDSFNLIKAYGGKLYFIIYDILPVQYPQFFSFKLIVVFRTWLKQITTQADGAICISRAVANELATWLEKNPPLRKTALNIGWFHLGAEMDNNNKNQMKASTLLPEKNITAIFDTQEGLSSKNILMVGTVEPRKDYTLALAAFNYLWDHNENINLIIVGKQGWKIDQLIKILKSHPQNNKKLFWFETASDALLLNLYQSCHGLLMTSQCEGFGLPLIEAARYNLPILARDIPVFHEVAQENVRYFPFNATGVDIAEIIKMWLIDINNERAPLSKNMSWLSWHQSMTQLAQVIVQDDWYTKWKPKNLT